MRKSVVAKRGMWNAHTSWPVASPRPGSQFKWGGQTRNNSCRRDTTHWELEPCLHNPETSSSLLCPIWSPGDGQKGPQQMPLFFTPRSCSWVFIGWAQRSHQMLAALKFKIIRELEIDLLQKGMRPRDGGVGGGKERKKTKLWHVHAPTATDEHDHYVLWMCPHKNKK